MRNVVKRESILYVIGVAIILVSVVIGLDFRNLNERRLALAYVSGVLFLLLVGYVLRKSGFRDTLGWW